VTALAWVGGTVIFVAATVTILLFVIMVWGQ
jgi:hypothetical protein